MQSNNITYDISMTDISGSSTGYVMDMSQCWCKYKRTRTKEIFDLSLCKIPLCAELIFSYTKKNEIKNINLQLTDELGKIVYRSKSVV